MCPNKLNIEAKINTVKTKYGKLKKKDEIKIKVEKRDIFEAVIISKDRIKMIVRNKGTGRVESFLFADFLEGNIEIFKKIFTKEHLFKNELRVI